MAGSHNDGWCAVFCNPASEDVVALRLSRSGWRCYLPKYRRLLRGVKIVGGRRIRVKGPGTIVWRPLFPRYLFAEIDLSTQAWSPIANCVGVARLVMESRDPASPPALIDGEVVELIRASVDAGDFDDVPPPRVIRHDLKQMLDAGERPTVRVNGHDIVGELLGLDDRGRASVLLTLLGRELVTTTDAGPLRVVAAD